ncbi:polyunsaturated fatty acid 5-lipoxygenase isoform X2 [Ictalurus punctatus]|nr:polyunsaturated fatty acid 5-lipoxygenase isoform X2 [Ictalurus punctatus]XP_017327613.1 polyunsaturated fatty acid 5-lipoxygenase isoform X2 [Ictalurus punctatus]XP_047012386.1 polyunsaturated fatty acid 5-lipoxygenase isoform X2 [Ictalurus punctatus]
MEYKVIVATGTLEYSGTNNYVYVTLVGENGESERTLLDKSGQDLCRGAVDEYIVRSSAPLGRVLLVRLEKQKYFLEDNWFCNYVKVTAPGEENNQTFPCYCWLVGDIKVEVRDGTAKKLCDEILPQELVHRKVQLQERQKTFRWQAWAPGIPKCVDAKSEADLPQDVRFANEKRSDFERSLQYALLELSLKKLAIWFGRSWKDLDDFKQIFWKLRSPIAEYTMEHWKEDWFFGHQFLNGSNPRMIQRCRKLPSNFPVVGDTVQAFLSPNTTLDKELKTGNVYLVDYAIIDGIPENVMSGKKQHIAAPLCLLYEHPDNGLIPIAIQLEQNPSKDTPIFRPNDPPLPWLLAKMWVRHAEFQVFQVLSHLLRTHLIVEVFCVATLRHLPAVHPIYKLLTPHLKYTLEINCRGRTQLISQDGIFKRMASTGGEGILVLSQREFKALTYRSLQPRCDFVDRGVTKLNKYFYREHSLMLWSAIEKFVSSIVSLYYGSDGEVVQDSELQAWIKDVVEEGFANIPHFGLPNKLKNKQELITLLSVVIFTSTAQHAAINNGQFDFCAWVPNTPCTMRQPPSTDKDSVTMELIMNTLPDVSQSCVVMAITWLLSSAQPDKIPLAHYKEEYFTESAAQKMIDNFRQDLKYIEMKILKQNKGLKLPYLYLCPSQIENSITI